MATGAPISSRFGHAELARDNQVPDTFSGAGNDWAYAEIEEFRWSQSFPYQLCLYKKNQQGSWERQSNPFFTLPIPPTSISKSAPAAIKTTVTLGGIVEEHNGSPLRPISFHGTTGILPVKAGGTPIPPLPVVNSILGGTIAGVNGVVQNATKAIQGPASLFSGNLVNIPDAKSSGYYQFLLLEKFFDYYFAFKKTDAGRNFALALEMHKDLAIYLVTLENFTLTRSASSPLEYEYALSFRAWRKILDTTNTKRVTPPDDVTRDPNALAALLTRITAARDALVSVQRTLTGISSDVNALVFEPLRQVSLFCKDGLGVALTAADLPASIVKNMKGAILEASGVATSGSQASSAFANLPVVLSNELANAKSALIQFSVVSGKSSALAGQQTNTATFLQSSPDPANKLLSDPASYYNVFANILPSTLNLTADVQTNIQKERLKIQQLTRLDFQNIRDNLTSFSADFANKVGYGNDVYNAAFGYPLISSTATPTTDDLIVLDSLNDAILELNQLVASPDDRVIPDPISYVAALASPFGINLQIPNSKVTIPMPYGSTLEMVAAKYLKDPDRWLEIAALNNLAEPYIDEVGFDLSLLVNGSGDGVVVSGTDTNATDNLFVGQSVSIVSSTIQRDYRTIRALTPVGSTIVIQLSQTTDSQDLNVFTVANHAALHAFLPNTVNSQQVIFIPSDQPEDQIALNGAPNPALANFQQQLQQGGADLLLTSSNDLAITPDGDCKLAVGLANLVQRIRLVIQTPIGSLYRDPEYGFPIVVGQSQADLTAQQILQIVQGLFQDDPSFDGVTGVSVIKDGIATTVNFTVIVAGSHEHLPLSFVIQR
jgi:hypothetical protein